MARKYSQPIVFDTPIGRDSKDRRKFRVDLSTTPLWASVRVDLTFEAIGLVQRFLTVSSILEIVQGDTSTYYAECEFDQVMDEMERFTEEHPEYKNYVWGYTTNAMLRLARKDRDAE